MSESLRGVFARMEFLFLVTSTQCQIFNVQFHVTFDNSDRRQST